MTAYPSEHPCEKDCAYGVCRASGSTQGCGGCCGCLGPCIVDWEIAGGVEQGAAAPPFAPVSNYGWTAKGATA